MYEDRGETKNGSRQISEQAVATPRSNGSLALAGKQQLGRGWGQAAFWTWQLRE